MIAWEGPIAAGVLLSALTNLLVHVYMTERMVDIGRCAATNGACRCCSCGLD